jgi:predicted phosphodiesterase
MSKDAVMGMKFSSAHTTAADKKWLGGLPREKVIRDPKLPFLVVHGFPSDNPANADPYDYVLDSFSAEVVFEAMVKRYKVKLCLFGHSHMPTMSRKEDKNKIVFFDMHRPYLKGNSYDLNHEDWNANALMDISDTKKGARYLFNAGAIGQPRHKNKVGFGILDTDAMTYEFIEFDYDIEAAMNAIKEAGGSIRIAQRLWIDTPKEEKNQKSPF